MDTNARDWLIQLRHEFVNNYLTVDKFAEHNGLNYDEARRLLTLAYDVGKHPHPEA